MNNLVTHQNGSAVIETTALCKIFHVGDISIPALRGIDLVVKGGEMVAVMGSSGSGKSTLMNLLGCLDQATSGNYLLDGVDVNALSKNEYADIRNHKIGFVFRDLICCHERQHWKMLNFPLFTTAIAALPIREQRLCKRLSESDWQTESITNPISCPVDNSKEWQSLGLWSINRRSYSPMNPPAISIAEPLSRSCRCSRN